MKLSFPDYVFSQKEIKDLKRRQKVAGMLRVGEKWQKIKGVTGAHLQTIAIISRRLKSQNKIKSKQHGTTDAGTVDKKTIFVFGHAE